MEAPHGMPPGMAPPKNATTGSQPMDPTMPMVGDSSSGVLPYPPVVNLFIYNPSVPGNVVGAVFFCATFLLTSYQFFKTKTWYFNTLPQAALLSAVGFVARTHVAINPKVFMAFLIQKFMIMIPPVMLSIGVFMTFTRIVWWVTPDDKRNIRNLWMPPGYMSLIFGLVTVIGDMLKSFGNQKGVMGMLMGGAALQVVAFGGFFLFSMRFIIMTEHWNVLVERWRWRRLALACSAASLLLAGRANYLVIEEAGSANREDYLNTHEWPFWVYDALPVLGSYFIFNIVHPGAVLPREYTRFKFPAKKIVRERLTKIQSPQWPGPVIVHPHDYKGAEVTLTDLELGSMPARPREGI